MQNVPRSSVGGAVYEAAATRPESGILIMLPFESETMIRFVSVASSVGSIVTSNVAGVVMPDSSLMK